MPKLSRAEIHAKYGGCCAYCGQKIPLKGFHVDHVDAMWRGTMGSKERDELTEKFPSCQRCNLWKKTLTIEQFRIEIASQVARVRRDSAGFRLAEDFGQIKSTPHRVGFYFEQFN